MHYRFGEKPQPKPRRTMQKTNTPASIYITNGQTLEVAIPCFYTEIESAKILKSKEAVKAIAYVDARTKKMQRYHDGTRDFPIHFRDEFENPLVDVKLDCENEGLHAINARVDSKPDDHIIRFTLTAECEKAIEKPFIGHFTIRLLYDNIIDVVGLGRIKVLPALL